MTTQRHSLHLWLLAFIEWINHDKSVIKYLIRSGGAESNITDDEVKRNTRTDDAVVMATKDMSLSVFNMKTGSTDCYTIFTDNIVLRGSLHINTENKERTVMAMNV